MNQKLIKAVLAVFLCGCILTGCTGQSDTEADPTVSPSAEPAAQSTAAPTPTPDPSAALEYEMLTLPLTSQPPKIHDSSFMSPNSTCRSNGYAFIEALYTNDAEKLQGALAASVLNSGLPLPDLTGLVITEVYLGGGMYEVPFATLTIADPGATGLPAGEQHFVFSFDGEGKVESFCMWDGELKDYVAQAMGLEPGEWVLLGRLDTSNETQEDLHFTTEIWVVGRKLDALGFKMGEVRAFSIAEQYTYDDNTTLTEYAMTSCQELPGDWPAPQGSWEQYTRLPEGNCLTQAELESVCGQLNALFTQLREGTYTSEWVKDPNKAALSLWNLARPVPVEVTPEVLRSTISSDVSSRTLILVPLPDGCWAVCGLTEEGNLDDFLGFSFVLTVPDGV